MFMIMWNDFISLLERIPATFWGVVIGSFFSLGGVILSNKASERRLIKQFDHERAQKNKDREMALRRDIYLAAAEAVSAGMAAIGRFPNLDMPNNEVTDEFQRKSPAISKVHVIATPETAQALSHFMGELNKVLLTLWVKRYELISGKTAISVVGNQIANFERARDGFLEQIRKNNIEGVTDKRMMDVLQQNFDFEQKRIIEAANRNVALAEELYQKQLGFAHECVIETNKLGSLITPILSAVRKELELPFDPVAYNEIIREEAVKQQEAFIKALESLKAQGIKPKINEIAKQSGTEIPD